MAPLLEVEKITRNFYFGKKKKTAVNQVSLCLEKGESLGIVGGSGCGKTTVVKIIARLLDAEEGAIRFMGQDITHITGKPLRQIYKRMQMVFQTPVESFHPRMTLGNSIAEGMINGGVGRRQARLKTMELLELCGLPESVVTRYPHQVSIGQCQRAAIARAVALEPDLLICDEITSALDATIQIQVLDLLESLKEKTGMSLLFVSHDLALVQQVCDRAAVMNQGQIIEEGLTHEVMSRPRQEYTRNLVEAARYLYGI